MRDGMRDKMRDEGEMARSTSFRSPLIHSECSQDIPMKQAHIGP